MRHAIFGLALLSSPAFGATECEVSKAQYDALKPAATYAEAVAVLGCEGEELSRMDMAGTTTIMLQWTGNTTASSMNAMFQNDKLVTKAQFGLE